jgi:hypothetical protein
MLKGIFKIFRHSPGLIGESKRLIGRVLFLDGNCHVLEDHDGIIHSELPEGPVEERHERFMHKLGTSYLFDVVPEDEIDKGKHPDLIPDMPLGEPEPEHEYLLQDGENEPQRVEIYDSHWIVNGKNLLPDEKNQLFQEIRSGQKKLFPI